MTATTTEKTQAELKLEVLTNTIKRLRDLKALDATSPKGYVHAWQGYSLGVLVKNGKPHTVGVENATVMGSKKSNTFYNGNQEAAEFVPFAHAIKAAIRNTEDLLISMVEAFDKVSAEAA